MFTPEKFKSLKWETQTRPAISTDKQAKMGCVQFLTRKNNFGQTIWYRIDFLETGFYIGAQSSESEEDAIIEFCKNFNAKMDELRKKSSELFWTLDNISEE